MTWDHRIVRHARGKYFAIHEVYYDDAGRAYACTVKPTAAVGDTAEEVIVTLLQMLRDAKKHPVIDYDAIPEPGAKGAW